MRRLLPKVAQRERTRRARKVQGISKRLPRGRSQQKTRAGTAQVPKKKSGTGIRRQAPELDADSKVRADPCPVCADARRPKRRVRDMHSKAGGTSPARRPLPHHGRRARASLPPVQLVFGHAGRRAKSIHQSSYLHGKAQCPHPPQKKLTPKTPSVSARPPCPPCLPPCWRRWGWRCWRGPASMVGQILGSPECAPASITTPPCGTSWRGGRGRIPTPTAA